MQSIGRFFMNVTLGELSPSQIHEQLVGGGVRMNPYTVGVLKNCLISDEVKNINLFLVENQWMGLANENYSKTLNRVLRSGLKEAPLEAIFLARLKMKSGYVIRGVEREGTTLTLGSYPSNQLMIQAWELWCDPIFFYDTDFVFML